MDRWMMNFGILFFILGCGLAEAQRLDQEKEVVRRTFLIRLDLLEQSKAKVDEGDLNLKLAVDALRKDADKAMSVGPFSVTFKRTIPPSGDKHDYMSLGPYWWPDPRQPDGLPYIRRDGETNPEASQLDRRPLGQLTSAVESLALAYFFTEHQPYADKAAEMLRIWFLDEETRMNPHLRFGQSIPGRVEGRGIGIIDTVALTKIVDVVGLLASSKAWSNEDQDGIEAWFSEYLDWLLTHEYGLKEGRERNNHGTWYDVQVASFALFVGRDEIARDVIKNSAKKRIASQIEPDGRQPFELARTKSFDYSLMNLRGMFELAELGDHVGVELGHFVNDDGRSIRQALDWLIPFAVGDADWKYQQLGKFKRESAEVLIRRAAIRYQDEFYFETLKRFDGVNKTNRIQLLWPIAE